MRYRLSSVLLVVCAIAVVAFVVLSSSARTKTPDVAAAVADSPPHKVPTLAGATASGSASSTAVPVEPAITADDIARWTVDASGGDAAKRAAAITALSDAPVAQALPVLRRVLMNGEPAIDRPLALRSLRDLALNQGDANSSIRNAIREPIYHGDDEKLAADAQEALDVIEESLLK